MPTSFPVHPFIAAVLSSVLLTGSLACVENKKSGPTTPVAGPGDVSSGETGEGPTPVDADAENPAPPPSGEVARVDPSPVATGSGSLSSEEQALLDHHNRVRADVKVAALTWSDKLKGVAAAWGQKLVDKGCVMEHSRGSGYGENLFMGSAEYFTMVDAAKSWEGEKKYYSGAPLDGSNWYRSGHYTQMVWRETTEIGCARVTCKGSLIVICNYNPPGNFMGQKAY
jgi:pathogenesis-related protein 1